MFPIVRYVDDDKLGGANARNWPGYVQVKRNVPNRAAVVAQEAWESMHKMDPINLMFRVFLRSKKDRRKFEYMGHECEVQAAVLIYGHNVNHYRTAEAMALHRGYDGLFAHMTVEQIAAEMRARSEKAKAWVRANLHHLRRHDERFD